MYSGPLFLESSEFTAGFQALLLCLPSLRCGNLCLLSPAKIALYFFINQVSIPFLENTV